MRKIVERSMLMRAWVADDNCKSDDGIVSEILCSRGITDAAAIEQFLNPSIKNQMPDPDVLRDMVSAVRAVADAVRNNKKIAVFGDYDVDGITSTAIVIKYLRGIGLDPIWHLPTRDGEGYGLNADAVRALANQGAEVLVTVDCGISGVDEIKLARELGMTVVVTDHHMPDAVLPDADAVINPKRADDESGLSYLAGVGVAFMFLVALNRELRGNFPDVNLMDFLDLVALGTICDTMPLVGLNRAFVATGLKILDQKKNLGLRILMQVANAKRASVYVAGFVIGPRLNAAGRLDSAEPALKLLLSDNELVAHDLAMQLNDMNAERIDVQAGILLSATEMADKLKNIYENSIFVCGDNWHGGVMGIIAGRLKDKCNLPTLVATRGDGMINGSGRSVPGVDLGRIIHDALAAGILSEGGGHAAAVGFSLEQGREDDFRKFLEQKVCEQLNGCAIADEIFVDAEMDAGAANIKLINELSALAPFGQGNPEPTLVLSGATLSYAATMGRGEHIRGNIRTSAGTQLAFVGFNMAGNAAGQWMLDDANIGAALTLCGKLKENEYNGRVTAQFVIEDIAI